MPDYMAHKFQDYEEALKFAETGGCFRKQGKTVFPSYLASRHPKGCLSIEPPDYWLVLKEEK